MFMGNTWYVFACMLLLTSMIGACVADRSYLCCFVHLTGSGFRQTGNSDQWCVANQTS